MKPEKLYYADTATLEVNEVPYTRDRAMSVTPIFHSTRKKALESLRPVMEENYSVAAAKLFSLWAELDDETATGLSKEDVRLLEKYGTVHVIDNLKRLEAAEEIVDKAGILKGLGEIAIKKLVKLYRGTYPKTE